MDETLSLNVTVVLKLSGFGGGIQAGGGKGIPFIYADTGVAGGGIGDLPGTLNLITGNVEQSEGTAHFMENKHEKLKHKGGFALGGLTEDLDVHKMTVMKAEYDFITEVNSNILTTDVLGGDITLHVLSSELEETRNGDRTRNDLRHENHRFGLTDKDHK